MRKVLIYLLIACLSTNLAAQPKHVTHDSYTIQRLIIENNKGEILIYKGKKDWMTPALRHNKGMSITEALQLLASSYGLTISRPKLAGLFTYKFSFKEGVSFRSFYKAKLIGDDDVFPPAPITETKWVAKRKIQSAITGLDVRKEMLKQVIEYPKNVWGGSFYIYDDEQGQRKARVLEDFYPLN